MIKFLVVLIPVAALTVFLVAFLISKMLRKHIITYLRKLSDAAVEYTERDNAVIDETTESIFESLDIRTADEMEDLWLSMTGMEADVKNSIVRLRKMTAEKEYAAAELNIASQIQSGMLPTKSPDDIRFELYASMDPAREVGGDLYDFFMIDDDHLAVVIADVSGKGVSASLFMVTSKNLIKSQAEKGVQDPAEMFNHVNRQLMEVNKAHMFVTAWLGILKLSTGELVYVDAGHEYPALRRKGGLFEVIKDIHSVPLAVKKKMTFESGSFTLNAGDTLFVYTDGVPEANNTEGRMMGKERMLEALNSMPDADPETIINNVKSAVEDFSKDAPQFDDTTMMCLRYLGSYASRVE
jgi:sigma-B regulation protein RsbU (phosphoserine phosphatase)